MKTGTLVAFFFLWCTIPVMGQRIDTVWVDSIPVEMVFVEGGTFEQGCMSKELEAGQCQSVSQPEHTVTLKSYYIAKFEVTRELYRAVMGVDPSLGSFDYRPMFNITPKCPVQMVSWFDTQAFMDSLFIKTGIRFRLPTEAEWEYAARAKQYNDFYSGGNDCNELAWSWDNVGNNSHHVGLLKPNAFGLYDMSGNVEEWCSDWFSPNYYQPDTLYVNPTGPATGRLKVIRGGSWGIWPNRSCELDTRRGELPTVKTNQASGIRLVMDAEDVKR